MLMDGVAREAALRQGANVVVSARAFVVEVLKPWKVSCCGSKFDIRHHI